MKLRLPKVDGDPKRMVFKGLNINMIHFKARFNTHLRYPKFALKQLASKY